MLYKMDGGLGIGGLNVSYNEMTSSNFDVFSPVEIENSIKNRVTQIYRPITNTNGSAGPFKFEVPSDPSKWTDASTIRLCGKIKVVKTKSGEDDSNFSDTYQIGYINNIYQSLWRAVDVSINGTALTDPHNRWYAYKSYIETLLSYSKQTKEGKLKSIGWFKDTHKKFDDFGTASANGNELVASNNVGYKKRKEMCKGGKWSYFCIRLHTDLTTLSKYLPPSVKLEFDLKRNEDEFLLCSPIDFKDKDEKPKIIIQDLTLRVDRYEATPAVQSYFNNKMRAHKKCWIPIDRSLIKKYVMGENRYDVSCFNLITSTHLPDQIIIGLLDENAYTGNYGKNPFKFQHFNVIEASIVVNGVHEPIEPYKIDISKHDYMSLYQDFLENTGGGEDKDYGIDYEEYTDGYFLLAFDRTKDKCNRLHRHIADVGSIDVNIRTSAALPGTVGVVAYCTYSSDIVIDYLTNKVTLTVAP